jgi:hypothetical protein
MSDEPERPIDAIRKQVHAYLAALTPEEAKALRTRFGFEREPDEEPLRALARELAKLKKKR